ncbi:MAG: clostripain-related cysteine peptidase, partial [Defluviitaleaceae bacterium]|nr:clostripain-related cysteine peptidase [Defluviitaleaceae bacterium]
MQKFIAILFAVAFFVLAAAVSIFATPAAKPYTIMIYMNGSDLESDHGLATNDLAQMLESGIKSHNANIIILTGGTRQWMNDAIPENDCVVWQLGDGAIRKVRSMGKVNMGHPDTLRDFITYSMAQYPAQKYGLIMWDHGGGTIAGFGHDEKFDDDSLSLAEMRQAFEAAGLGRNKLEFLGYDACLMATVEMAVLAADYAHVLVASQDLEPGEGWDYRFLSVLNDTPHMDGFALGKVIVDSFIDFFGEDSDELLALSVTDLARVQPVMDAMGDLMAKASDKMIDRDFLRNWNFRQNQRFQQSLWLRSLAERRAVTKTFGEGSPRDNYADMVDVGDMALMLKDFFPQEAEAVLQALENCVVYSRHNSDIDLWGLSAFYVYGGKSMGRQSLQTYGALGMDSRYTAYLQNFLHGLKNRDHGATFREELALMQPVSKESYRMVGLLQTHVPGSYFWPVIHGRPAVMFPISATKSTR